MKTWGCLLLLAMSLCTGTGAQTPNNPPPAAAPKVTAYLLGPEDVISIRVINFPELTQPQLIIPADGQISVTSVDEPLLVIGKTTTEVAALLTTKWRRFYINPSVSVSLVQQRKESVLIYG